MSNLITLGQEMQKINAQSELNTVIDCSVPRREWGSLGNNFLKVAFNTIPAMAEVYAKSRSVDKGKVERQLNKHLVCHVQ